MTKFEELQQAHQHLLDRMDEVSDKAEFAHEVQRYITQVCDEAADVSAPRDRDQLRANLRFWASYVYDATGTYPNTTMRPARPVEETWPGGVSPARPAPAPISPMPPSAATTQTFPAMPPPPAPASSVSKAAAPVYRGRRWPIMAGLVAAIAMLILCVILITSAGPMLTLFIPGGAAPQPTDLPNVVPPTLNPGNTPTEDAGAATSTSPQTATPSPSSGSQLSIDWTIVTQGPSPSDPNVWAARIKLSAQGGNNVYIYWVDGQRLPDASAGEFTIQGQSCETWRAEVGVTSDDQVASQLVEIISPLSHCP
jgi:hypothetical protein